MSELEFNQQIQKLSYKILKNDKIVNVKLQEEQIEKLYQYYQGIIAWNEKINLTSIKGEGEFIIKHYLDSLTILPYVKAGFKILDVGTGAGFPGIPVAIYLPDTEVTLIDSVKKKLHVIETITQEMNMENVRLIHTRAEDFAKISCERESYDLVVSRAVASMPTLIEYLLPFVKKDGIAICMKGPNYEEELQQSKGGIELLGGKVLHIEKILIEEGMERTIIIIKKISKTPKIYPRGKGLALKKPLI